MIDGFDADHWRRAGALFHEFVVLEPEERSTRLAALRADPALRSAVEALLAGDAAAETRLPAPGFGLFPTSALPVDPLRLVGRTVSHFRIEEHLASGGMGVVYRAEDLQLHRAVALKFLLPSHQLTPSAQERFLDEARSAGALDHPNLCPVHEIGESPAGRFLAMPLYRGETLKDRLARTGPLSGEEALAIVEQIAAGLHCAHAAGIVHRDIKPGNVMLLPDGTVKILDFGLAKVETDAPVSHGLLGTVSYMAPEQIRRDPVDARTDFWALGVMLHEMVTGARPFTGEDEAAILHAIAHEPPCSLAAWRFALPPGLEALIGTLLQKDRGARYPNARVLVEAVATVRRGGGGVAPLRPHPRSIRRLVIAAGALTLALFAGAYVWIDSGPSLLSRGAIAEHDLLVVADFNVAGPDTTLGPFLANAFRGYLLGSRVVSIMPQWQIDSALQRRRDPRGAPLDPARALDVARREGARAVIEGDLASLDAGHLLRIRLVAAATGDELTSFSATVAQLDTDLLPVLERVAGLLRRRIGESLRDVRAAPPVRRLTTPSLEALRLLEKVWRGQLPQQFGEPMTTLRAIVAIDPAFAYAWLTIGNHLASSRYRTAARDSAYTAMYRLRDDRLTVMEYSQVTGSYWGAVGLDRRRAIDAYEQALVRDSFQYRAILNLADRFNDTRQFERAERLLRHYEYVDSAWTRSLGGRINAHLGRGDIAAADSLLAGSPQAAAFAVGVALAALRFDTAADLAGGAIRPRGRIPLPSQMARVAAGVARVQGRLIDARRFDAVADSIDAAFLRNARVEYDPAFDRPVVSAGDALWLLRQPDRALVLLDSAFSRRPLNRLREPQDRIDAVRGAALYAAAGRPDRARAILDVIEATSDSLMLRATHVFRYDAFGEIALAEGRPREAMALFRESDLAADGLPATRCAVCLLPRLARAAERAGWADSARIFWERYATMPALDRLDADQWFLVMAYERLGVLYADADDHARARMYHTRLAELWKQADLELRRR